jgi:hypothetical protein
MSERLTLVCSQCGTTSAADPSGWHLEWSDADEVFYCGRCWAQTPKPNERQATPDWRANARARRDLLRPFKDETVVAVWARKREGRPFPIRLGSIRFLDAGETLWYHDDEDGTTVTTEDLFGFAWIYRCPLHTWPIPFLEGLSLWDFIFGGADLRLRRSLNDERIHDQLLAIVQMTSPTSNPDASVL